MRPVIYIALFFFLASCSGKQTVFENEAALQAYVNDPANGYISSVETADFIIETKLVPAIAEEEDPQLTIHLRISRQDGKSVLEHGASDQQEALEREGYLSFGILGDVYLESGGTIQPAIFHHYERNYGLKPSVDLFFQFNQFTPAEDVVLVYRDQVFNQGMIRIPLNQSLFTICHVQK